MRRPNIRLSHPVTLLRFPFRNWDEHITGGPYIKGDDLQNRLTDFAVRLMELCDKIPKTFAGKHVGEQLFRSGTASAANYAEVRGAESRNDFIHKLGLVRKELNETWVWLRIVELRRMLDPAGVEPLRQECDELCRIIAASRKTAEENLRRGRVPSV